MIFQHTHQWITGQPAHGQAKDADEVGKTYAVQPGRGMNAIARIRITDLRLQMVDNISIADVEAEGFAHADDFLTAYKYLNKCIGEHAPLCWAYTFELVVEKPHREAGNCL